MSRVISQVRAHNTGSAAATPTRRTRAYERLAPYIGSARHIRYAAARSPVVCVVHLISLAQSVFVHAGLACCV
jgi:hypothetical protein